MKWKKQKRRRRFLQIHVVHACARILVYCVVENPNTKQIQIETFIA